MTGMTTKRKPPYSMRLSPAARKLLDRLARKFDMDKSAVVELALRQMADK